MTGQPEQLRLYVIYDHPRDYPGWFVARAFDGDQPGPVLVMSDNLQAMRIAFKAYGLTRIPRQPGDDPVIVETWL